MGNSSSAWQAVQPRYIYSGFPWHKGIVGQRFCQRCLKVTQREIHRKYIPGAPCASMARHSTAISSWYNRRDVGRYIMHITDLRQILPMWQDVMRGVRELHRSGEWNSTKAVAWLSDMIAFSIASINHNLPWSLREDMMLSKAGSIEAWPRVSWKTETEKLPYVLHYCQPYEVDKGKPTSRRFYKHDDFYERMRWNPLL